ncbi:MAG: helix-turn-helix domain-containing protein [Acidobacteria bacterium]|nr:helix-turn-helix domain-containing protein [Acidobacteriota bacterium]
MSSKDLPLDTDRGPVTSTSPSDIPFTVQQAALFLGVRPLMEKIRVERKQIPHLRVMGRNIRFLRSDLEPFRTQFKQEVENGQAQQA